MADDRERLNDALFALREVIATGDLSAAEAQATTLNADPARAEMGPVTGANVPRRLHAVLQRLAKAKGDLVAQMGWQVLQGPPVDALAAITTVSADQRARAAAMADTPVPRVFHQIWIGPLAPPPNLAMWRDHARQTGFAHKIWDMAALAQIGVGQDRAFCQMLADHDYPGAVDIARYHVLRAEGGVYLDADWYPVGNVRAFSDYAPLRGVIALAERMPRLTGRGAVMLGNGVIGVPANHPAMDECLRAAPLAMARLPRGPAWWVTGPMLFTLIVRQMPVGLLPDGFMAAELPRQAARSTLQQACAAADQTGGFMVTWKSW